MLILYFTDIDKCNTWEYCGSCFLTHKFSLPSCNWHHFGTADGLALRSKPTDSVGYRTPHGELEKFYFCVIYLFF